jgi:hypothetical protein
MKLYVLVEWTDYEGESFMGVFSSFDKAVEAGCKQVREEDTYYFDHLRVWECELDKLGEWCGESWWKSEAFRTEVCHKSESGHHKYATNGDGNSACVHCGLKS